MKQIKAFNKLYYILYKKSYINRIDFLKKDNINFSLLMIIINFHDGYNIKTMHYKHIAIILEIKAGYLELYNKLESILHKKE